MRNAILGKVRRLFDTVAMAIIQRLLQSSLGQYAVAEFARRVEARVHQAVTASLKTCGHSVRIQEPVLIAQPEAVEIGDEVSFAAFVHIWGAGGVRIGARTMIGSHTAISSVTHDYTRSNMHATVVLKRVEIGPDVWIGAHSMIMAGVTIGEGAVIGAGSIITHDVAPFTIVAGVPARLLKERLIIQEIIETP